MCFPDSMSVWNLLREFRIRKVHMAVVLNEYGGTVGVCVLTISLFLSYAMIYAILNQDRIQKFKESHFSFLTHIFSPRSSSQESFSTS